MDHSSTGPFVYLRVQETTLGGNSMTNQINALLVEAGADFGDHAETTTHAVFVDRDESVGELTDRLLSKEVTRFRGDGEPDTFLRPDPAKSLVIRLAVR
jgi:hypothetical protein